MIDQQKPTGDPAMPNGYQEYPLTLCHPHFRPATSTPIPGTEVRDRLGNIVRVDYQGTSVYMPPVTVKNEDDEAYHAAQGYVRAGKIDPSAWIQAHSSPPVENYQPQKYPMWRDGVLYMTAQEDPGADPSDMAPSVRAEPPQTVAQPSADENMRSQMEAMQETMRQMAVAMADMKDQNARLKSEAEAAKAEPKPGRPRKPTAD